MSIQQKPLAAALCLLALPISPTLAQNAEEHIVVTATRQPMRANELLSDVTVIDRKEIEAAGPAASITDLLARQPGVEINRSGGAGATTSVFMRGSNTGHTLLLVDGVRVGSATLGSPNWTLLPLQQIERIEILRGAASSLYGSDAIGGVIQVFTRKGDGPLRFNAEAGIGSHDTSTVSAGLSGSHAGLRYNLQAANHYTRGINSIRNKNSSAYNPDSDAFKNTSASGNISYTFAQDQELGLSFLHGTGWNDFDASWPGTASDSHRNKQSFASYNLNTRNRLMSNWISTLRIGRSEDDSKALLNGKVGNRYRTTQQQVQWQNDVTLPLGTALLALERLDQKVSSNILYEETKRTIDSYLLGWQASIDSHRLQTNLRRDNNSQYGDKNTGSVAYGYQLSPSWRTHISYGTAFKAPTFNDLYYPKSYGWGGNPDLRPETSKNREIALHYDQGPHQVSLTLYRNDVKDLICWTCASTGPVNINTARLSGVTLAYTGTLGDFDLKASADFQNPRDQDKDKLLPMRARQHASLSVGRQYGAMSWNAELQANGKRYGDGNNTRKLGGYTLMNLQAEYAMDKDWSVFARANNIFDRKYTANYTPADWSPEVIYNSAGSEFFLGVRYAPK